MPKVAHAPDPIEGVVELTAQGHGFLRRDPNWIPSREDLFVPNGLIRRSWRTRACTPRLP